MEVAQQLKQKHEIPLGPRFVGLGWISDIAQWCRMMENPCGQNDQQGQGNHQILEHLPWPEWFSFAVKFVVFLPPGGGHAM